VVEDEGSGIPDALKERLFRHSLLPRVMASVWGLRFAARSSKASADPLLAETARNGAPRSSYSCLSPPKVSSGNTGNCI
jgi:hypothetical protein